MSYVSFSNLDQFHKPADTFFARIAKEKGWRRGCAKMVPTCNDASAMVFRFLSAERGEESEKKKEGKLNNAVQIGRIMQRHKM